MRQRSLLEEDSSDLAGLVRIVGSRKALTPAQRRFNQLIERIDAQRRELADWKTFGETYHQQLAEQYRPALARLRDKQIAMAVLLDKLLEGPSALGKRERAKTRQMLLGVLSQILVDAQEPELVSLYDKHAPRSFDEEQQEERDIVRALASEEFGVEMDAIPDSGSSDDLAEWIDAQLHARSEQPARPRARRKSAKSLARETERAHAAEGGTQAVRELFRKLASELHPDRETDPAEQVRKTELMQRVNQAYKAGNLLALLELQLQVEQIDLADLAALAEERLAHYIFVLEEQSQRLRDEQAAFVAPFALALDRVTVDRLTPAIVRQALQTDIHQIEAQARGLQQDLTLFRDIRAFRQILRDYAVEPADDADFGAPVRAQPRRRRKGSRRR